MASKPLSFLVLTRKEMSMFFNPFFNCYLAAPRPTLGHYQGGSPTHPMSITAFLHIQRGGGRERMHWEEMG